MTERAAEHLTVTRSGRLVKLTEEGRELKMDITQKNYKRLAEKLQKDARLLLEGQKPEDSAS